MKKYYSVLEVSKKMNISFTLAKSFIQYVFTNQYIFRVFKVDNIYLIDKHTFDEFVKLNNYFENIL